MAGLDDLALGENPLAVLAGQSAGPLMRAQALSQAASNPQSGFAVPGTPAIGKTPSAGLSGGSTPTKLPSAPPAPDIDPNGALNDGYAAAALHTGKGLDFANIGNPETMGDINSLMTPTSQDKSLALAQAGFAMAGSGSPYFGVAMGKGMSAGLDALQTRMAQRAEAAMRVADLQKQSQQLAQSAAFQNAQVANMQAEREAQQQQLAVQQQEAPLRELLLRAQAGDAQAGAQLKAMQAKQIANPLSMLGFGGGGGGGAGVSGGTTQATGGAPPPGAPSATGADKLVPVDVPKQVPTSADAPELKGLPPVQDEKDNAYGSDGAPVGQLHLSAQGKATFDQLPAPAQAIVGAMLDGRMQAPSGYALGKSPMLMSLVTVANQIDPNFDQANWAARAALRKSVMGGGKDADNISALRLFYQHIGQLNDDQMSLHNGDIPAVNWVENMASGAVQGDRADALKRIQNDTNLVSNEAMKVARGTGTPSEKEAESFRTTFSPTDAYHVSLAGNQRLASLVQARMDSVDQRWKDTFGDSLPFNMLTPEAQAVHDNLMGTAAAPTTVPRIPNDPAQAQKVWDSMKSGTPYINRDGSQGVKP